MNLASFHTPPHAEVLFLQEKASKHRRSAFLRPFEAFVAQKHLRVRSCL
jgi:hypothetical protein